MLRLGSSIVDIATAPGPAVGARGGVVIARHQLAPTGAGAMIRDHGHVHALELAAMGAGPQPRRTAARSDAHRPGPPWAPPRPFSLPPAARQSRQHRRLGWSLAWPSTPPPRPDATP